MIGKVLGFIWLLFFGFSLSLTTQVPGFPDHGPGPGLVVLAIVAGAAIFAVVADSPAVGPLALSAGLLLWLVVALHCPDPWYLVAALLGPGLLVLLPTAVITFRVLTGPPPDVIWTEPKPPHTEQD